MSPVRKPPPFSGRTLVIAAAAILVGVALLWAASAALTARHNHRTGGIGAGGVVELGNASRLAAQIRRGGDVPIYFPDVSGNDRRAVYLAHKGPGSNAGWTAFLAQVPGAAPSCQWQWNPTTRRFDASCDERRHASAEGTGLVTYPVTVVKGKLRVDLRPQDSTTTTSAVAQPDGSGAG